MWPLPPGTRCTPQKNILRDHSWYLAWVRSGYEAVFAERSRSPCCPQGKLEEVKGEARGSVEEAGRQVERGVEDVKGRVEDAGDSLKGKD